MQERKGKYLQVFRVGVGVGVLDPDLAGDSRTTTTYGDSFERSRADFLLCLRSFLVFGVIGVFGMGVVG